MHFFYPRIVRLSTIAMLFPCLKGRNDVFLCGSQRTFCSFLQTLSFNMSCITSPAMTGRKSTAAILKVIKCSPVQKGKGQCLIQHCIDSYADIDFPTNQLAISSSQIYCFSLNIVLNSTIRHSRSSLQPCRYVFIGNRCCKWSSFSFFRYSVRNTDLLRTD